MIIFLPCHKQIFSPMYEEEADQISLLKFLPKLYLFARSLLDTFCKTSNLDLISKL